MNQLIKLAYSSLFIIFAVNNSLAQKLQSDRIFISLYGGKANTTFYGKAIDERINSQYAPEAYMEERKGIVAGANVKFTFHQYFFIRSGVAYAQRGAIEKKDDYSLYPFKAYLDYVSVPVLFGFQPLNFDNVRSLNVYIQGGVVSNFEVSRSKDEYLYKGYSVKPEIKKHVFSYEFGAGAELKLFDGFAVFGNYTYFKDFTPFFSVFNKDPYKAYNKGTSISIGCMIDVTKFRRNNSE